MSTWWVGVVEGKREERDRERSERESERVLSTSGCMLKYSSKLM